LSNHFDLLFIKVVQEKLKKYCKTLQWRPKQQLEGGRSAAAVLETKTKFEMYE